MLNSLYRWFFPHTLNDKYLQSVDRLLDYCISLLNRKYSQNELDKIQSSLSYLKNPDVRKRTATLFRERNIQKVEGKVIEESNVIYLELIAANDQCVPPKHYSVKFWPCDICPCVGIQRIYLS